MKAARLGLLCGLMLVAMMLEAGAAESYRFDMGGKETPVAKGWTQVTDQSLLTSDSAFGWVKKPREWVFRNIPGNPYYAQGEAGLEFALYSDHLLSIEENTFVFKVKPGRYAVTVTLGDLSPGESRPDNSVWANGERVVTDLASNANVMACTFPVKAPEGQISLRFRADSLQKYVCAAAVSAEAVAADAKVEAKTVAYPAPDAKINYQANWERFEAQLLADWAKAKQALAAEGVDVTATVKQTEALKKRPDYREYFPSGFGRWDVLDEQAGGLNLAGLCGMFKEMGIDGLIANSALAKRELPKHGMRYAIGGHAENFPGEDMAGVTLNLLRNKAGKTTTQPRLWSNCDPKMVEVFRELWTKDLGKLADGAAFFMVDEPRGQFFGGADLGFGDYSTASLNAFQSWCKERGWAETAAVKELPAPGRTQDFYRFYLFRLETPPLLMERVFKGTPFEKLAIMPGNGDIGPATMNHSSNWPPAIARRKQVSASWAYDDPESAKMHAEVTRLAGEFGGSDYAFPPIYPEARSVAQSLPITAANLSALSTRVCPWQLDGALSAISGRDQWFKLMFYSARLAHATSGLKHTPPLYVWCPDSIVFNDLVEISQTEAGNWKQLWKTLFDANLDYKVTNQLQVPKDAVLLYACVKPVLTAEEFARLEKFVQGGGTLLCTFKGAPETPDAKPLEGWGKLPKEHVVALALEPKALGEKVRRRAKSANLDTGASAVKSYLYQRAGKTVHLLNNTEIATEAKVKLAKDCVDLLSGKPVAAGVLTLPAGQHALLQEQ